ncbi:MAG: toxin-antitoxin system YwqK family antitoxin [Planctomycetota bacterium]
MNTKRILVSVIAVGLILMAVEGCSNKAYEFQGQGEIRGQNETARFTTGGTNEKMLEYFPSRWPAAVETYDGTTRIKVTHWFENKQMNYELNCKGEIKHGMETAWYQNGQKEYEYRWEMGSQVGPAPMWFPDGKPKETVEFVNGRKEGMDTVFFPDGRKETETLYKDGLRTGVKVTYFPTGAKQKEETYVNDKLNGLSQCWYPDGQLQWSIQFRDDNRDGPDIAYDRKGQKQSEGQNMAGKKVGHWVFYKNGAKDYEGDYDSEGHRNGTFRWFGPGGNVISEKNYVSGVEQ